MFYSLRVLTALTVHGTHTHIHTHSCHRPKVKAQCAKTLLNLLASKRSEQQGRGRAKGKWNRGRGVGCGVQQQQLLDGLAKLARFAELFTGQSWLSSGNRNFFEHLPACLPAWWCKCLALALLVYSPSLSLPLRLSPFSIYSAAAAVQVAGVHVPLGLTS